MKDCIISKQQILKNCDLEIVVNHQSKIHLCDSLGLNNFYMID